MSTPRCPICQQPTTSVQLRVHSTCGNVKCRLAHRKLETEQRWNQQDSQHQRKFAAKVAAAESYRDLAADQQAIDSPQQYHVIVAPANRHPLVPLSRRRRYQFAKKLIKIVESVFANDQKTDFAPSRAADESSLPILTAACGTCQGKCCRRGGTHAFLSADVIRRFCSDHPGMTAKQVIRQYVRLLPKINSQGSCVFHGETGCTLPKTMRSGTCNVMACGALAEMRARAEVDGTEKFLIAAMEGTEVIRAKFVCANTNAK